MTPSNRRDPRVNIALEVQLQTLRGMETFETLNVSHRGIFIVTDAPLPLRRITRLQIETPTNPLNLIGMVAHSINMTDALEKHTTPGMGIQIFPVGPWQKDLWIHHVDQLIEQDPELSKAVQQFRQPKYPIHLANPQITKNLLENDIPKGQIFYRTPDLLPIGTEVSIELSSPLSARTFTLKGHIQDVSEGGQRHRGVIIRLPALDAQTHQALHSFAFNTE